MGTKNQRGKPVKFIVQWSNRPGPEPDDNIEASEGLLKAFASWAPPESLSITEFVARVDGRGGLLICETDDLAAIDYVVAQYTPWFDYDVYPVLDVAEGAAKFGEGTAWDKAAMG